MAKKTAPKVDWIIHYICNGARCADCGEVESGFINYACNAHTHGMENYNHLNFQVVLNFGPNEVGRILNTLGLRVQAGEKFKDGDMVKGIYEDCDVRLTEFEETDRKVLRVVIPDQLNTFPDEKDCMWPYTNQALKTEQLSLRKPCSSKKGGFVQ
ncbi:MAG: DUF4262 domain-containing protein [Acutalibacteraceae bacterium]|nr:DUF4262 domain-containing protein [Acutalibacteraceae bacterium]